MEGNIAIRSPQLFYKGEVGITVLDDFITEPQRLETLSFFDDMEDSTVCTDKEEVESREIRTGKRKFIEHDESMLFYELCLKISLFIGVDISHAEKVQLLQYGATEKYDPHFDGWDTDWAMWEQHSAGGQRIYTVMGYLNDVHEGGETDFPVLGIKVQPRAGRLLVFNNVGEDKLKPHPDSLHAGVPVVEGIKQCFTIWFREGPIEQKQ